MDGPALLIELLRFIVEIVLDIGLDWYDSPTPRERHRRRVERIKARRRNRKIRRWLRKPDPRKGIPDIGLRCRHCNYLLTGLTGSTCPECGNTFDLRTYRDESADPRRSRRKRDSVQEQSHEPD